MKKQFFRALALLLTLTLLTVPNCAALAEEWSEDAALYELEPLEDFPDELLYESESFDAPPVEEEPAPVEEEPAPSPELPSVTWAEFRDGQLSVGYHTGLDARLSVAVRADEGQEPLFTCTVPVSAAYDEISIPLDGAELPEDCLIEATIDNGSDWETVVIRNMPAFISDSMAFDAQELTQGVYLYAEVNDTGDLNFSLLLPEGTAAGDYTVTPDDAEDEDPIVNAAGETTLAVFNNVRPHELDKGFSLKHGQEEPQHFALRDYLAKVPESCEELDMDALTPANRAQYSGGITGVEDWHAGLRLEEDDSVILLCFRAKSAEGLVFDCDGHNVSDPKQEADGLWFVRVQDIRAGDLPADLVITVTKGEETATLQYSPFCYAAAHWDEDTPFVLLCRAMAAVMDQAEDSAPEDAQT